MLRHLPIVLSLVLATPALGQALPPAAEAALAKAPAGTRFGLLVVDEAGREVAARDPDGRFMPASNTKLFTTAAAYALIPGMDRPDEAGGTAVALGPRAGGGPDVWLIGRGDARMSSAADCTVDCLATLADAVAARTRMVSDVIGDDSLWVDQRWAPGMSWNNIGTESGTAVGALNLDDNVASVTVAPTTPGQPPRAVLPGYFTLRNEAVTVPAGGQLMLGIEPVAGGRELRLFGQIPATGKAWRTAVGVDDPALYAAWRLRELLMARGVTVSGAVRANHRAAGVADDPAAQLPAATAVPPPATLAALVPPPLAEDVATINKRSQNLHAQALLRRLSPAGRAGATGWALRVLADLLVAAGVPRAGFDLADGAGMSSYNRFSPRAGVALLRWGARQPWGAAWRASLPVGGVDGTLARRFARTPLEGRVWAKTGTLNATNALTGWLRAASGRELAFTIVANDVPDGTSALPAMDAALLAIAAAN